MSGIPNIKIKVLTGPEDVADFWSWLTQPGRTYVAVDTETSGLDIYEPGFHVRMFQVGDKDGGWAIPFQGWSGLIQGIFNWCSLFRMPMAWWNFNYDSGACEQEGISIDYTHHIDLYVLAGLGGNCDQTRELKPVAIKMLGQWAGLGQSVLKDGMHNQKWTWETVPFGWKPYPMYGVLDTCITGMLWETDEFQYRYKRWRAMHDLEIETIRLCNRMVRKGLKVDLPYLRKSSDGYLLAEMDIEEKLMVTYGITPGQNDQIVKILKEAGKYPDDAPLTDTGKSSLTAAVLKRCDHRVARAVLKHRAMHKTRVTYLDKMIDCADGDSLVHCNIQPMQARTSRMSISRPALQQLPSADEVMIDNVAVREGVIAHSDDENVATFDFAQIELRIWATIMDDKSLAEEIKIADVTGLDFFTSLCRSLYHEPEFQKKDHRRTQVKSSVYAKLFSGGIEVAAATAGIQVVEMIPTWHLLGHRFPSMKNGGIEAVVYNGKNKGGYIDSPMDRRFSVAADNEMRKLSNYACQGTAAIALKQAQVGLEAAGLGEYLVLPVHDEIVSSIPKALTTEVMEEMNLVMDSVIQEKDGWLVGVPAAGGYGDTWAAAK